MSKVKWIIEDFAPENSFGKLAEEVRRQGMDCEVITYEPLQKGSFNKFGDEGCIIFQGSLEGTAMFITAAFLWITLKGTSHG